MKDGDESIVYFPLACHALPVVALAIWRKKIQLAISQSRQQRVTPFAGPVTRRSNQHGNEALDTANTTTGDVAGFSGSARNLRDRASSRNNLNSSLLLLHHPTANPLDVLASHPKATRKVRGSMMGIGYDCHTSDVMASPIAQLVPRADTTGDRTSSHHLANTRPQNLSLACY